MFQLTTPMTEPSYLDEPVQYDPYHHDPIVYWLYKSTSPLFEISFFSYLFTCLFIHCPPSLECEPCESRAYLSCFACCDPNGAQHSIGVNSYLVNKPVNVVSLYLNYILTMLFFIQISKATYNYQSKFRRSSLKCTGKSHRIMTVPLIVCGIPQGGVLLIF